MCCVHKRRSICSPLYNKAIRGLEDDDLIHLQAINYRCTATALPMKAHLHPKRWYCVPSSKALCPTHLGSVLINLRAQGCKHDQYFVQNLHKGREGEEGGREKREEEGGREGGREKREGGREKREGGRRGRKKQCERSPCFFSYLPTLQTTRLVHLSRQRVGSFFGPPFFFFF